MVTTTNLSLSNNQDIDGALIGWKWNASSLTYSFPTDSSQYGTSSSYGPEVTTFVAVNTSQQDMVRYSLNLINQYTGLTFSEVTESSSVHGTLRFGNSNYPSTAYAVYPSTEGSTPGSLRGGDVWYNNSATYTDEKLNDYSGYITLHEIGHTLGLKHGNDTNVNNNTTWPTLPSNHDGIAWSIMTYSMYPGDTSDYYEAETHGAPTTYMQDDIAALQYMYGANFSSHSGNNVYTWNPTTYDMSIDGTVAIDQYNNYAIFQTIWDGNGTDTYDLSNWTTPMTLDLQPGAWSTFDTWYMAPVSSVSPGHYAPGNVANALLYQGDTRSYIENAYGGSNDDIITGNAIANELRGYNGNDTIYGLDGNDLVYGGAGNDTIYGGNGDDTLNGGGGSDTIYGDAGNDTLNGDDDGDLLYGGAGNDTIAGGNGTDESRYAGDRDTYHVTYASGTFTIVDERTGAITNEGTDSVNGSTVEYIRFAGGGGSLYTSAQLQNDLAYSDITSSPRQDGTYLRTYRDGADAYSWGRITENYTSGNVRIDQSVLNDTGDHTLESFDYNNNQTWSDVVDYYNVNDQRYRQYVDYDATSPENYHNQYWDIDGAQNWDYYIDRYDAVGFRYQQYIYYDDGSSQTINF